MSDSEQMPGEYEVGYGRPPKASQFHKGQSGNPKGRPKGSLNLAKLLERTLCELVVINEGGRRKTITKLEAALKQLVNKAAAGDLAAIKQLTALARSAEERVADNPNQQVDLVAEDKKVMVSILKRLQGSKDLGDKQ